MKYQVFISSVSKELSEERTSLLSRLLAKNRYFPIAMEYFTASNTTIDMLYGYLKQTDIYVLLLKNSPGSAIGMENAELVRKIGAENESIMAAVNHMCEMLGVSLDELTFTQIEYAFAQGMKLITFMFVYSDGDKVAFEKRIQAFLGENTIHTAMKWQNSSELVEGVVSSLDNSEFTDQPLLGWVRMADSPLYRKTYDAGIRDFALDGREFTHTLYQHLSTAKELLIFYTTGKGFVHNNQELLADFIARGGNIRFACGMPQSEFLKDIAEIEIMKLGYRADINEEFFDVMENMKTIYSNARHKWESKGAQGELGHIQVAGVKTLFRSSILICVDNEDKMWGWVSVTLPPEKSVDMISMELEYEAKNEAGQRKPDSYYKDNLLRSTLDHFNYVWQMADKDNLILNVTEELSKDTMEETVIPRKYWEDRWKKAQRNMNVRKRNKAILIEVAAQHPLRDGFEPDTEFEERLEYALSLYEKKKSEGYSVEIYVPGSVHLDPDGVPDECSLSTAGMNYLLDRGVDESDLHGDDLNDKEYEGRIWQGVYNSADECFAAAQYFLEDNKKFSALYCVCSPYQLPRKMFFYLENGVIPCVYTVPVKDMFHNFLGEMFECIPYVISEDRNWQGEHSREALRTRRERMPEFKEKNSQ